MRDTRKLGKECDEALFRAVKDVLATEGAEKIDCSYGVGGSQEIRVWTFSIGREVLKVTAETYMGLSIEGDAEVATRIATAVQARLGRQGD